MGFFYCLNRPAGTGKVVIVAWGEIKNLVFILIGAASAFVATAAYQSRDTTVVKAGSIRAGQSCRCCFHCNCPSETKTCPRVAAK